MLEISAWKDKALFTPGPLTTSRTVKQAMLRDLGSRDDAFIAIVRNIRDRLVQLANGATEYTAVVMQGSGTFAIESVISSAIPRPGKLLVLANGAYGRRIADMARVHAIAHIVLTTPENRRVDPADVERHLAADPAITHVAVVHCETTTGLLNPASEIGAIVYRHGRVYIVDAMSSFGAVPIDVCTMHADYLISSANKCIEGVPGFGFVIARRAALEATAGFSRTLSLDLHAQWKGLESDGQFRFTPPTHALLAFQQALNELDFEGGVKGRADRYRRNHAILLHGMRQLGFEEYLPPTLQGYIITSFRYPAHPNFNFKSFYSRLAGRGVLIYPGKVTDADCFRIGTIGRISEPDVMDLVSAIRGVLEDMEIELPAKNIDILTKI